MITKYDEQTKYAGILIGAFNTVLESFSSKQIVSTAVFTSNNKFITSDISVMIGVVGDLDGGVTLCMNAKAGQILASEMLGGIEITEVDELVISAVSELCNMIMGIACSSISADHTLVDITPPIVNITGKTALSSHQSAYNISILLKDLGNVDLLWQCYKS